MDSIKEASSSIYLPSEVWCHIIEEYCDQPLILASVNHLFEELIIGTESTCRHFISAIENRLGMRITLPEPNNIWKSKGSLRHLQRVMNIRVKILGKTDIDLNIFTLPNFIESNFKDPTIDIPKWFGTSVTENYPKYALKTLNHDSAKDISAEKLGEGLVWAAKEGYQEIVSLILEQKNAQAISTDHLGAALASAVVTMPKEINIQILACPEACDIDSEYLDPALKEAVEKDWKEIVVRILDCKFACFISHENKGLAFNWAAKKQFNEIIRLLFSYNDDFDELESIFLKAAENGLIHAVQCIFNTYPIDQTVLIEAMNKASRKSLKEIVHTILKHMQSKKLTDKDIFSALSTADGREVELLIYNLAKRREEDILYLDAEKDLRELVQSIFDCPHASAIELSKALLLAIKNELKETAILLLSHPNAKNIPYMALNESLYFAMKNKLKEVVSLILNHPNMQEIKPDELFDSLIGIAAGGEDAAAAADLNESIKVILEYPKHEKILSELISESLKYSCENFYHKISLMILNHPNAKEIDPNRLGKSLSSAGNEKVELFILNHPNAKEIDSECLSQSLTFASQVGHREVMRQILKLPHAQKIPKTLLDDIIKRAWIKNSFDIINMIFDYLISRRLDELEEDKLISILDYLTSQNPKLIEDKIEAIILYASNRGFNVLLHKIDDHNISVECLDIALELAAINNNVEVVRTLLSFNNATEISIERLILIKQTLEKNGSKPTMTLMI